MGNYNQTLYTIKSIWREYNTDKVDLQSMTEYLTFLFY